MSYLDEPDDDRTAEGRSGERRRRRASQPARPAWDAATYGRPDDTRRPVRRGSSSPSSTYPSYAPTDSDPHSRSADPYPSTTDPYPPSPDPYSRSADPYVPPNDPYAPSADPYAPSADPYAPSADPYSSSSSSSSSDDYAPSSRDAYTPPYRSEPSRYPMAPSRPPEPEPYEQDSFAPDRYTSFRAAPESETEEEYGPPQYVAQGLYLDAEGARYQAPVDPAEYPGGLDEPPAEPANGRAGRNLPAAIGVGVGLGAAVLASLFFWRPAFLGVVAIAVGVGVWELVRAIRHTGVKPPLLPLVGGGVLMVALAWWGHADALTFGLMVTVLAAMVWRLADGVGEYGRDVTAATFVAVYVPFLGGFVALLATPADGDLRVLVTLAAVVLSDTGGYVAGVFFGKRPMAPSVSPKKSWEGLGGSLLASGIGSAILLALIFDVAWWWGVIFGIAVAAGAVIGDLGESMVKRDLGVKDMSSLLPGHGGLMDRLDSILIAAPTAYLLFTVFLP